MKIFRGKYKLYLQEEGVRKVTHKSFLNIMSRFKDYDIVIAYLKKDRGELRTKFPNIYIKEDSIKAKYNEYKKLTPYNPCTYVTFWNYYTIERQSFEEIVNTKFSKGGPRTLGLGEITNSFNKAKEKGYKNVYSTYYKQLKNNTLELKRR